MDDKDRLILAMGDELLRMSRQLSKVAEKKMPSSDSEILKFVLERLENVYGEPPNADYMNRLRLLYRETTVREHFGDSADEKPTEGLPVRDVYRAPKVLDVVPPTTVQEAVKVLLKACGEDPNRPGLIETPDRFCRAWDEMTSGYREDVSKYFKTFPLKTDEMVVVRGIPFTSFCEHHLLPFSGVAHVGYIPQDEIIGLSKIARIFLAFAKRLQVQELLTKQVTVAFEQYLPSSKGTACVVEASHTCMACRGVRVQGATMITSSLTGAFRDKPEARAEFFSCIRSGT